MSTEDVKGSTEEVVKEAGRRVFPLLRDTGLGLLAATAAISATGLALEKFRSVYALSKKVKS